MKIGILTLFHGNDNWGGTLQGVALKRLLENLYPSADVDIVDYRSDNNVIYSTRLQQALQYKPSEVAKKIVGMCGRKLKKNKNEALQERKKLFKKFRTPYVTNKHIYTDFTISELEDDYDVLICGSDQIWNPNVARPAFFLKGVGDDCKKISYAASIARDSLSKQEADVMIPLIENFDFISVREKTAKNILQDYVSKPITEVLDPALMFDEKAWIRIAELNTRKPEKPYALAFFFSDSLEYRKYIEKYCANKGLKMHFIPHAAGYIKNDEVGECERLIDVGPKEFLEQFMGASCVFTDSFHGSVFSLIFQKDFWVFERDKNNRVSKNSRLYDLLDKFELSDRLVREPSKILSDASSKVDFSKVNQLLEKYRAESKRFILNAIGDEYIGKTIKSCKCVDQLQKEDCCGCSLCTEICPRKCIVMQCDAEGYAYPSVDKRLCIECGACIKICKEKLDTEHDCFRPKTYLGYNPNENVRCNSSSGGIFYEVASQVLEENGVVYGAAFNEKYEVVHMRISDKSQIGEILRSKYVQSVFSVAIKQIENDLKNNLKVLVAGTPCQIAAISRYAEKLGLSEKLYLFDFVCHGVPSPGVWQSYLSYVAGDSKIHEVNFRDKSHAGWHDYYLHILYGDNSQLNETHELNAYMRSFLSDYNLRWSCYNCAFKDKNYASDITVGDAWKIEKDKPEWADDKGTSLIIVRSEKGANLISQVKAKCALVETDYDNWVRYNPSIVHPTSFKNGRAEFFHQYKTMNISDFWAARKKVPLKRRLRYSGKKALKFVGLEKVARRRQ